MKRSLRSTFGAAALAVVFLTGCSQSIPTCPSRWWPIS